MKKILYTITTFIIAATFIGCGGGGGGGSDAHFKNADTQTEIAIDIDCVLANPIAADIATYITLNSGDTIISDDVGSQISVYHDITGAKKVCRVAGTGNSHILR